MPGAAENFVRKHLSLSNLRTQVPLASALHIGRIELTGAEASTSPSYRWDTAQGVITVGGSVIICPFGMPPPSSGSPKATTTCNSSHVQLLTHATPHTRQVLLQLEEPVPEFEGLASAPDRHRSHPSKYNSALEGPSGEGLQLT